jgi:hypothetical protein
MGTVSVSCILFLFSFLLIWSFSQGSKCISVCIAMGHICLLFWNPHIDRLCSRCTTCTYFSTRFVYLRTSCTLLHPLLFWWHHHVANNSHRYSLLSLVSRMLTKHNVLNSYCYFYSYPIFSCIIPKSMGHQLDALPLRYWNCSTAR